MKAGHPAGDKEADLREETWQRKLAGNTTGTRGTRRGKRETDVSRGSYAIDQEATKQEIVRTEKHRTEQEPELSWKVIVQNMHSEAYSLGIEWDLSQGEAEKLIKRWFAAFPEIETWMQQLHEDADSNATAQAVTLLGRSRPLWRKSASGSFRERGRARRVAGNTPVQGSAADVVLSAMGRVEASPTLQEFGFRLILQIHDELVLEGPEKHAEEALSELVRLMEDPLPFKLKVPLKVNACHVQSWQDAKA